MSTMFGGFPTLAYNRIVSKTYANMAGYDTAACFNITGTVLLTVVGQVGATGITCTSTTTTLRVGTTKTPDAILDRPINGTNFTAGDVWTEFADSNVQPITPSYVVGNSQSLILTRSVDDILGGVLTLYCIWQPISSDGNVVAA